MHNDILHSATSLSDATLLSRLLELAQNERTATVELIVHLAEMDTRKLYRGEGYGSLFDYCTGALRLSEHAAYNRIEAARLARTFPIVLERLADGSVNLTTLRLLAPHLRPENHREVLAEAAGKKKRDVEAMIVRLAPRPDVPDSVRKLPEPLPPATLPEAADDLPNRPSERPEVLDAAGPPSGMSVPPRVDAFADFAAVRPAAPRAVVAPLAPERYRVQFTVGRETYEKLRLAQDLTRRENPDGDLAVIFDRGLTLQLAEIAKRKLAATSKPRPDRPATGRRRGVEARSRHIPAAIKRKVWLRDQGRCAFVARSGRRCAQRAYLEFHHVEPYAIGGEPTAGNISLRCRTHNVYEAELAFPAPACAATRSGTSSTGEGGERPARTVVARSGVADLTAT
jgi:hypothetical protein